MPERASSSRRPATDRSDQRPAAPELRANGIPSGSSSQPQHEVSRAAAESLVLGHDRLERIEENTVRIPKIENDIVRLDKEVAVIRAQIDLLKWMNGIVIAGVLALIITTFFA